MGLLSIPYQSKSKLWIAIFLVVWSLISMHFIWQSQANSGLILKNELSLTSSIPHEFEMLIDTYYPKFKPTLGHSGSQTYLNLFKNQDRNAAIFSILKNFDLEQRCQLYFKNVKNDKLIVDPDHDFKFDRFDYLNWDEYRDESIKRLKGDNDEFIATSSDLDTIKKNFDKAKSRIASDLQLLHDYFSHIKIYNQCYIDRNTSFIKKQHELIDGLNWKTSFKRSSFLSGKQIVTEQQMYPWLSQKSPEYNCLATGQTTKFAANKNSFLNTLKNNLNGKGIVMTIADAHIDYCIRLIHLLRYLKNTLPIQIIYTSNDLSAESKSQLHQASVSDFDGLPQQNITLVNVTPAIKPQYLHKFNEFGNKILAILFNTFEEMIFIDADAILIENPEKFFQLTKYKNSGALFFRDRNTSEYRPDHDIEMFLKLMNSQYDEIIFGLLQITEKTMSIPLFDRKISHVMESGLVLLNRKVHFSQPLIMANMNFFEPIRERVYGDKEMFWLSLSIIGDENYQFNSHPAAAIGQLTTYQERVKTFENPPSSFKSQEICANHPAHISDEDNHTLLWFNSGFQFCNQLEKVNYEDEFSHKERYSQFDTIDKFKTFWQSSLVIESAIIPPENTNSNGGDGYEPSVSWKHMEPYCAGYTWCAYSSIGNGDQANDRGLVINYSPEEIEHFKKLGEIWMRGYNYL